LGAPARFSLIEATTKAGKTVGAIAWLYELAFATGAAGRNFWWVAPISAQSRVAFDRMKLALPRWAFSKHDSDHWIRLQNGAKIWFKSGDNPDSLYGEDVYGAVIDEASRCKPESWYALRSTLTATRGPCRMIGNVNGRRNWFYEMSRLAEKGMSDHSYHKIIAADAVAAGVLVAEEIEGARLTLPDRVFRELYLAEASDDGGNPFGLTSIEKCVAPLSTAPVACWGWDLGKSVDWTVGIGLDVDGKVAAFERWQRPWPETLRLIIDKVGVFTPALVDSTGLGDPIVEFLQKEARSNFVGFKFSLASKQKIMEGLAVAVQRQATSVLDETHREHRLEMESFEYKYTATGVRYQAVEGMHDDIVCAHALAVEAKTGLADLNVWHKLV